MGCSPVIESSATGTRGTLTMPASMASISEKSETTQGNSVAFGPARAAEEERRGRKIVNGLHADLGFHGLEPGNPDAGLLVALLGFVALVAAERFLFAVGLAAVAVMGFVVEDDDVLLVAQFAADAADHLIGRFGERTRLPVGENRLGELAGGDCFAQLEGVVVRDEDFGLPELVLKLGRHDVALAIVVLRVVGQQHAEPVADGDAGRDDQECVGEAGVLRVGAAC